MGPYKDHVLYWIHVESVGRVFICEFSIHRVAHGTKNTISRFWPFSGHFGGLGHFYNSQKYHVNFKRGLP